MLNLYISERRIYVHLDGTISKISDIGEIKCRKYQLTGCVLPKGHVHILRDMVKSGEQVFGTDE